MTLIIVLPPMVEVTSILDIVPEEYRDGRPIFYHRGSVDFGIVLCLDYGKYIRTEGPMWSVLSLTLTQEESAIIISDIRQRAAEKEEGARRRFQEDLALEKERIRLRDIFRNKIALGRILRQRL